MPAFRYEAVDDAGATRKGVVNADSPRSARSDLRLQGLTPISVEAIEGQLDASGVAKSRGFGERLSQV
ncbi:MAG: type II secretion system protein GspF, partial [Burkholderiaceae bacterium]|nr:type II secretion system protein GspF [Burkholderiaceae bacterium]